jgi:alpha,alpha-trehalase
LYHSKYGFPSWDPQSTEFDAKRYWRGPIWCIINYLLCVGFNNIHEKELSNNIKKNTIKLIETFGFFEYFDPYSGKGYGGDNFTWTAAIYLVFKNSDIV